jgi:hypothetical protein
VLISSGIVDDTAAQLAIYLLVTICHVVIALAVINTAAKRSGDGHTGAKAGFDNPAMQNPLCHGSPVGRVIAAYFPPHARRILRVAGVTASGGGVGAETAMPCSTACFLAVAKVGAVGLAAAIRAFLRVRFTGSAAFFTCSRCLGVRFQPFRVQCQPCLRMPLAFILTRLGVWLRAW